MFVHNFKYSLKVLLKNRVLIFWTFAFPIIMAFLFNMAFSNITNNEKLKVFDIALVENEELKQNEFLKSVFDVLGDKNNEQQIFNVKYTSLDEAKNLLDNEEVEGYLIVENKQQKVFVKNSGVNQTIFQNVVKEINQKEKMVNDIISNNIKKETIKGNKNINYNQIYIDAIKMIEQENANIIKDVSNSKLDYTMIEYYTLIAMACLYGAILGMTVINSLLANMSKKGMRISVSPAKKVQMVLSGSLAAFLTQIIGIAILFVFTIFILHIEYGNNLLLIILLALVGCLAGLSMGVVVGTSVKKGENTKMGILIAVTMLGCFLSGMMGITMKYMVDTNCPIINKINPANMITDGFYSLYYYNTMDRYWINIISLLVFSIILITISTITLRRQKYDSI